LIFQSKENPSVEGKDARKETGLGSGKETVLEQAFVKDVQTLNVIVKNGWVSLVKVCTTFNKTEIIRNNVCK
jgi:hypothetical protein